MSNALNPYMQGKQAGMARPYAQIQSGGKVGVDALMAARQANAMTPTVTQGRNVQMVNIDPARDIRATADANRLDLRARMNNDAAMDMEAYRQQSSDARALTNNEFTAEQNKLNRELDEQQLEAQLANTRVLQGALFNQQSGESQKDRLHSLSIEDKRLANTLQIAGVNSENAIELATIRGGIAIAQTTAELGQRAAEAAQRFKVARKELKARKDQSDADRTSRESEAAADRSASLQGIAMRGAYSMAGKAMDFEIAEAELEWREKMFNAEHTLKKREFKLKETARDAFSDSAGAVVAEYDKWQSTGSKTMTENLRNQWVRTHGVNYARQGNLEGGVNLKDAQGNILTPFTGKSGRLDQKWVNALFASLDDNAKSHYSSSVTDVVTARDREFSNLLMRYLGSAAASGTSVNIPPNSLQPRQPQAQGKGANPTLQAKRNRLIQLRQKAGTP
jgi:hypothetical protein